MQLKEWLLRNNLSAAEVSRLWGVSESQFARTCAGYQWPSATVLIRSYELTGGQVTMLDWIETSREKLQRDGIIKPGEQFHGQNQTYQVRGPKPRRRKASRSTERLNQQDGSEPAA